MKLSSNKILSALILLLVLNFSFLSVACDPETEIEKAAKASIQLSGVIEDTTGAVRQAYEQKLISFEQKNKIAEKLKIMNDGAKAFNGLVKEYSSLYKDGKVPPDKMKILETALSEKLLMPFADVIAALTGNETPPELLAAIAVLRTTVQAIANIFGRSIALNKMPEKPPAFVLRQI